MIVAETQLKNLKTTFEYHNLPIRANLWFFLSRWAEATASWGTISDPDAPGQDYEFSRKENFL